MEAPRYKSFQRVVGLKEEELRKLLRDGDGPERVWSAWALGLLLGQDALSPMIGTLSGDPSPGVRRNLIVFIAGSGDTDSLKTLAESDPDEGVRLTACQYILRVLQDTSQRDQFLDSRLEAETAQSVRIGILKDAIRDLRLIGSGALYQVLKRGSNEERALAVNYLDVYGVNQYVPLVFPEPLVSLASSEADVQIAANLCRLCFIAGNANVLLRIAELRSKDNLIPLNVLVEFGVRLSWNDLAEFVNKADPEQGARILDLIQVPPKQETVSWLVGLAAESEEEFDTQCGDAFSSIRYTVRNSLYDYLGYSNVPEPSAAGAKLMSLLKAGLENAKTELDSGETDDWDDDVEEEIEYLEEYIKRLAPWSAI